MIPRLTDLSLGHRIALTFVIVFVILLALFFIGGYMGAWDQAEGAQQEPELYQGVPPDAKLLPLDRQALDEAYKGHLVKLWNVWLSDGAREAHRITNGLRIARQSYAIAAKQIEQREEQLQGRKP
jgi:hypothetical protein